MKNSSEVDPLLPQTETSPEISAYGSTPQKTSREITYNTHQVEEDDDDARSTTSQTSSRMALGNLTAIFTFVVLLALVTVALFPKTPDQGKPLPVPRRPAKTIEGRVARILDETPLIDGHNDFAIFLRAHLHNKLHTPKFKQEFEHGGMPFNVDLPRLRQGKVGGAFWSAFVGCPDNASYDFSDQEYGTPVAHTLQQIDLVRRLQALYPDVFTEGSTPLPGALSRFHSQKSMISPISIEGLHQVPQSAPMSTLRTYHSLGVRAATLTWNCHNAFADAALISSGGKTVISKNYRNGLTSAGRAVIREMNRLGMLVDLSHTSYWTQKAVLTNNTSAAPVFYSHSSAFSICPHPRNVHDDILDLVKKTDSLVMVNFSPAFISCLPPSAPDAIPEFFEKNNTLHQVARHIVYIGNRIGWDHVGLGSDFDGMGDLTPKGLDGVDKYPNLIAELLEMGVSDDDAAKVVGGNLLRVWSKADEVARQMQIDQIQEGEDDPEGW